MEQKLSLKELLGCLPQGLLGNFLIGAAALILGIIFGGPKIYIDLDSAIYTFGALMLFYLTITCWCVFTLASHHLSTNLVTTGPYRFVRHPMYSAIIFILNPALGILFRSWWLILAVIPIYFLWRHCIKKEDKYLEQKFGQNFLLHQQQVWPFFPNLWRFNKILFYALVGVLVFAVTFISLNYSAVYLRWFRWEKRGKITHEEPVKQKVAFSPGPYSTSGALDNSPQSSVNVNAPDYNPQGNSIIIRQISVEAPLVFAQGTSQKELNAALNQGVIIYSGSALPGQRGEVFLSGHSSVFPWVKTKYGQVFTLLDKLEKGDTVSLVFDHHQYDYQVVGKEILFPSQMKIYETSEPRLTLSTCWPIGTALKRLVVKAELIR